jgi:hypothetical protein
MIPIKGGKMYCFRHRSALIINELQQNLNFQVLMRSQNLNEAQKLILFTAEVLEMSQIKSKLRKYNFFLFLRLV